METEAPVQHPEPTTTAGIVGEGRAYSNWLGSLPRQAQVGQSEPPAKTVCLTGKVLGGLGAIKAIAWDTLCGNLERSWDFGPDEILLQEHVLKRSRYLRQWRPRWAVLTPHGICTFAQAGDIAGEPTESMSLRLITAVTRDGADLTVHTAERDVALQFSTQSQAECWGNRILRHRDAETLVRP